MFCSNCGGQNVDSAKTCVLCGNVLVRPEGVLRRDGNDLIIPQGAALPPYCVRCGQPSEGVVKKTFSWHQPWLYILVISPLIYIIVALIVSKRMKLEVPMCAAHRSRRRLYLLAGWLLFFGFIPLGLMVGSLGQDMDGIGFLVGFGTFIASLVFLVLGSRVMVPKEIDDREGRFGGVHTGFIDMAVAQSRSAASGAR